MRQSLSKRNAEPGSSRCVSSTERRGRSGRKAFMGSGTGRAAAGLRMELEEQLLVRAKRRSNQDQAQPRIPRAAGVRDCTRRVNPTPTPSQHDRRPSKPNRTMSHPRISPPSDNGGRRWRVLAMRGVQYDDIRPVQGDRAAPLYPSRVRSAARVAPRADALADGADAPRRRLRSTTQRSRGDSVQTCIFRGIRVPSAPRALGTWGQGLVCADKLPSPGCREQRAWQRLIIFTRAVRRRVSRSSGFCWCLSSSVPPWRRLERVRTT